MLRAVAICCPHDDDALMPRSYITSEGHCAFSLCCIGGVDKEDLHNARWAEIPRQDYVDAARFLTAHGMAYDGVSVKEERARELFAARGRTIDAVQRRAVPISAIGALPYRLDGPADTGCAGTAEGASAACSTDAHGDVVAIDGEECSEQDEDEAAADDEEAGAAVSVGARFFRPGSDEAAGGGAGSSTNASLSAGSSPAGAHCQPSSSSTSSGSASAANGP